MCNPLHLGEMRLDVLTEQNQPGSDAFWLFPNLTGEELETYRARLEPLALEPGGTRLILPKKSYIVRKAGRVILIDTCLGNHKNLPAWPEWHMKDDSVYMDELARVGLTVEDVDFVMCTHLHIDHVGWNTKREDGRWVPTFPNATYIFSKQEFDHWNAVWQEEERHYFGESVLPVLEHGQERLVANDYEVIDGVKLIPTPGHTPDHCAVQVNSKAHEVIVTGDMIHSPLQMWLPHLDDRADWDTAMARRTREAFMDRYADTDTIVAPIHFPEPSFGRFVRDGDRYDFNYLDL